MNHFWFVFAKISTKKGKNVIYIAIHDVCRGRDVACYVCTQGNIMNSVIETQDLASVRRETV